MTTISTEERLFLQAIKAAQAASVAILSIYNGDFTVDHKADDSPVTRADLEAQQVILSFLHDSRVLVISEEAELPAFDVRSGWERFWLVDPLDGTKEFIHRNGEFTVNIALIHHGLPLMGVVLCPVTDELYAGWVGNGVWHVTSASRHSFEDLSDLTGMELAPIGSDAADYTVAVSRSHSDAATEEYLSGLKKEKGRITVLPAGSSMKFCLVAAGKADEYPRFGPTREWDTAAGHAVLLAAGRNVYRISDGSVLMYNQHDLRNGGFIAK